MDRQSLSPVTQILLQASRLPDEAIRELEACIRFEQLPRNTLLLGFGQIASRLYYLEKGLARAFYLHQGRDVSDYFALEGHFIGAVPSLFTGQPSHKAMELLEDASVWSISSEDWENLCQKYHAIEHAGRKMLAMGLLEEQQRIESIRFLSAAERYAELEKSHPGISLRCPLKHIASYLGISQVSLSRIRAGVQ